VLISLSRCRKPDNEVEDGAPSNGVKAEVAEKTEVPTTEAQTTETTAPAVTEPATETKEAEKAVEEPAAPVQPEEKLAEKVEDPLKQEAKVEAPLTEESTVQDIVDKTQASKAGQLPELETESEGKGKYFTCYESSSKQVSIS
jgi:hypothetical protein